ncbi:hypothetical protein LCGC14_0955360 [marine sediment metagenome]|uniref:SprT-like domain-containing protein n=1 Tax=marine sediment metagenome TaxID=412755 RepID=A0A0F9RMG9_9ZZZZ
MGRRGRSVPTPQWATELAREVTDAEGTRMPTIDWREDGSMYTGGRTWTFRGRILINAGTDLADQKLVLLHELAHAVLPPHVNHSARFWATAFRLYREHGLDLKDSWQRERSYKQQATRAAARAGLTEAQEIVDGWTNAARTRREARATITEDDKPMQAALGLRPIRRTGRYDREALTDRTLYGVYGGKVYEGTVVYGYGRSDVGLRLSNPGSDVKGARFDSLSAAAKAITGRSENGWTFWMLAKGENE